MNYIILIKTREERKVKGYFYIFIVIKCVYHLLFVCLCILLRLRLIAFNATLFSINIVTDKLIIIIYCLFKTTDKNNLCEVFTPTSPSSV